MVENLTSKHNAKPIHELDEIKLLIDLFPSQIECICAFQDDKVVSGALFFNSINVCHCQYIGTSDLGSSLCSLDLVFNHSIAHAKEKGFLWFDFGTSNAKEGLFLNESLYTYKSEFGGTGITHDFYKLKF